MKLFVEGAGRVLSLFERALLALAFVSLIAIAVLVILAILARSIPAFIVPDSVLIVSSLMVISISFSLAYATATRAHIAVDLFYMTMGRRLRRVCDVVAVVAGIVFTAPLTLWFIDETHEMYVEGRTVIGALRLPEWPTHFALVVGFALVALRLLQILLSYLLGLEQADSDDAEASDRALPE